SLSLFVLVLGFGEGDLIHGSTEPYAVDDVRIIAEGRDFFRASLAFLRAFWALFFRIFLC
ncbi:hypothetical protein JNO04_16920, partial [Halomonas sp. MC140]